jgi:Phytanoyl-CoA dioxygenase (PhyH)
MTAPADSPTANALGRARALEHDGDLLAAIETLNVANRAHRDPALECELVRVRHLAFLRHDREPGHARPIDPPAAAAGRGPLTVTRDGLSPQALNLGIRRHGCVYVPGLIGDDDVRTLVDGIDRAFDALEAHHAGDRAAATDSWYVPFRPAPEYNLGMKRKWVVDNGGLWTADSPPMLFSLLEIYRAAGVIETIAEYLGERPALSVNKSTLKRIDGKTGGEWHQDGAFLGADVRTVNVWLSLSHCGRDAPGLDILPRRVDHVLETGTEGAAFSWAVGPGIVERLAATDAVARPVFEPGDALLFDELFLHRTAAELSMPRERYAIEMWFFAPSAYPDDLVPLLV